MNGRKNIDSSTHVSVGAYHVRSRLTSSCRISGPIPPMVTMPGTDLITESAHSPFAKNCGGSMQNRSPLGLNRSPFAAHPQQQRVGATGSWNQAAYLSQSLGKPNPIAF